MNFQTIPGACLPEKGPLNALFPITLRYAAVTQETVRREYFTALESISKDLEVPEAIQTLAQTRPPEALSDLVKWLHASPESFELSERESKLISRRIQQIQRDIGASLRSESQI